MLSRFSNRLSLQARIILVLIAVIVPTFIVATVAQNQIARPVVEEELKQVALGAGRTLAKEIVARKLLSRTDSVVSPSVSAAIEALIQDLIYTQPLILRVDVVSAGVDGVYRVVGSNFEEDPGFPQRLLQPVESSQIELIPDENGMSVWDVRVPIESKPGQRVLGHVHVVVSLRLVGRIASTFWRTTSLAAIFSVVTLILALSFFLRRTIENDRKLRQAETENVLLTTQLDEAQRQLMNMEKLAVMGELTASFAHEIGTPLNAINGHLQLLSGEVDEVAGSRGALHDSIKHRLAIISGQLSKIEEIVRSFLQSTAKPVSQKQLVDVNSIIDKTLGIVRPRLDASGIVITRDLDRSMGPIRAVPLDLEQVLLNLVNNSIDSLRAKAKLNPGSPLSIEVTSRVREQQRLRMLEVEVTDSGEGVAPADLARVFKPFFTTKQPSEGTGLGLTICQQLVKKYGGSLAIQSKQGAWTRLSVRLPARLESNGSSEKDHHHA